MKKIILVIVVIYLFLLFISACERSETLKISSNATKEPLGFSDILFQDNAPQWFAIIDDTHTAVISSPLEVEAPYNVFTIYENGKSTYEIEISNRYDSLCYNSEDDCFYSYNNLTYEYNKLDREFNVIGTLLDKFDVFEIKAANVLNGRLYFTFVTNNPYELNEGEELEMIGDYVNFGERMYIIDLNDYSVIKPDIPGLICQFCDGNEMFCYIFDDGKYKLCKIDKNGNITASKLINDVGYIYGFGISDDIFTYFSPNSLYVMKMNLISGQITSDEKQGRILSNSDICSYKGNMIWINRDENLISVYGRKSKDTANVELEHTGESLIIGANNFGSISLKTDEITNDTGIKLLTTTYPSTNEELLLKLMAGDSDVDIYILYSSNSIGMNVRRNGIYEYLSKSKILQNEFSRWFEYLSDYCYDKGRIWCVPIKEDQYSTFYIPENMKTAGIDPQELITFEGYFSALRKAKENSEYIYYSGMDTFASFILYDSYNVNYSYSDYNTQLFKYLFQMIYDGWKYSDNQIENPLFNNPYNNIRYKRSNEFETNKIIFKSNIISTLLPDDNNMDNWRAVPLPKITENANKNPIILEYAIINPFSQKKEAALELLEYVTVNNNKYGKMYQAGNSANFFYRDRKDYLEIYDTTSPLFDDIFKMYDCGEIWESNYPITIETYKQYDYQEGRYTIDEVAEFLNHQVEMAKNE